MKLRTRIALIAGAVIFLAVLFSDGAILRICRRALLDRAVSEAALETKTVSAGFETYLRQAGGTLSREQAVYYFKSRGDDYTLLLRDGAVWYNNTVLSPRDLEETEWWPDRYITDFAGGRRLLVFQETVLPFTLYHVADITQVYLQVYSLAARVAVISLTVLAAAIAVLIFTLRRALKPLQALSQGAQSIAAGAYDRRVPADRRDEIGALGRDFNRMAQAVQRHITEVEASEEKKTLFMGNLTHELKTPLTAISGYAQTMRSLKLSEEEQAEALGYIVSESARLDRLSKKMMRLLELDHDTGLCFEPVAASELFEAAKTICAVQAQAGGVEVVIGESEGVLQAEKDLMTDAVVNLLDNAIKASSPGGRVLLYTREGSLVVEDQGRGIPPEDVDKITEPFYMVDRSRSRKSGGAGLGLALTAAILRRHDMTLRFESQPGQGTKVYVFTI